MGPRRRLRLRRHLAGTDQPGHLERGRQERPGRPTTHKVRVYPLKDAAGAVVVGSYIVAPEDVPTGVDYQDAVFIVSNVKAPAHRRRRQAHHHPAGTRLQRGPRHHQRHPAGHADQQRHHPAGDRFGRVTGTDAASFTLTGVPACPLGLEVGGDAPPSASSSSPAAPARSARRAPPCGSSPTTRPRRPWTTACSAWPPPVSRATTSRRSRPSSTPSATRSTSVAPV